MSNHSTTTPRPAFAPSLAAAANDNARLLDVLGMELARLVESAKADEPNWGFLGDLQKVRHDLIKVLAFTSGMDTEEVERFLNDE